MKKTKESNYNIGESVSQYFSTSDYLSRSVFNAAYNNIAINNIIITNYKHINNQYNYIILGSETSEKVGRLEERIHNLEKRIENLEKKLYQIENISEKVRKFVSKSINLFLKIVLIPALVLSLIVCILVNLTNMAYVNIVSTGLSVTIILLVIAFLIELKRLICKYVI